MYKTFCQNITANTVKLWDTLPTTVIKKERFKYLTIEQTYNKALH